MGRDLQHQDLIFRASEMTHFYGPNVHILSSPILLTLLSKLGSPATTQPQVNELVCQLYQNLTDTVIDTLFPKKMVRLETRMKAFYEGQIVNPDIPCVTVDLARAGTYPSHLVYQKLNYLMNPLLVRQDHFYVARECDEAGQVTGVNISGSKIGGEVSQAIVLLPDPMGATGGTIVEVYNHYKNIVGGRPLMMIAMHLIVTPEYLKKVTMACPDLHIFSIRLDRGLSSQEVLNEIPGKLWDSEIGLNNQQYIVPGAGGLGEILNNSYC
jgi:uracil phosphoribosyltransferase